MTKFSKWVENTVAKGEIARQEQFLLFPVFSNGLFPRGVKRCHCVGMGQLFTRHQDLTPVQIESMFGDDNFSVAQIVQVFRCRVENLVGKGEKCWLPAFSSFSNVFKGLLFQSP